MSKQNSREMCTPFADFHPLLPQTAAPQVPVYDGAGFRCLQSWVAITATEVQYAIIEWSPLLHRKNPVRTQLGTWCLMGKVKDRRMDRLTKHHFLSVVKINSLHLFFQIDIPVYLLLCNKSLRKSCSDTTYPTSTWGKLSLIFNFPIQNNF